MLLLCLLYGGAGQAGELQPLDFLEACVAQGYWQVDADLEGYQALAAAYGFALQMPDAAQSEALHQVALFTFGDIPAEEAFSGEGVFLARFAGAQGDSLELPPPSFEKGLSLLRQHYGAPSEERSESAITYHWRAPAFHLFYTLELSEELQLPPSYRLMVLTQERVRKEATDSRVLFLRQGISFGMSQEAVRVAEGPPDMQRPGQLAYRQVQIFGKSCVLSYAFEADVLQSVVVLFQQDDPTDSLLSFLWDYIEVWLSLRDVAGPADQNAVPALLGWYTEHEQTWAQDRLQDDFLYTSIWNFDSYTLEHTLADGPQGSLHFLSCYPVGGEAVEGVQQALVALLEGL